MIVSEIRLRFNKFANMKIKSYKDGKQSKKYVSKGKEKKAVIGAAISAGTGLITGGIDAFQGAKERKELLEEEKRLRATAPAIETPAAFRQAVKDSYDRGLLEQQNKLAQQALGTSVEALGQAGGRALLGGIGGATQRFGQQTQQAALAQAEKQSQALARLAAADERTGVRRQQRFETDLRRTQALTDAARKREQAGYGALAGGAAGALGILGTAGLTQGEDQSFGQSLGNLLGAGSGGGGLSMADLLRLEELRNNTTREKGGVMRTKGEFSHDSNPIDLVQNGEKVGEATGGEYIFNPQQSKKMYALAEEATSASGSAKKKAQSQLAKFVRSTLKRFEKDL
jgi:hypothetical protein